MWLARLHISVREIHPGLRLLICAVVGGVIFRVLQDGWGTAEAAALGWVAAVLLFLLLTALAIGVASPDRFFNTVILALTVNFLVNAFQ
jgi:uncharacterized membrane protein